MPEGGDALDSLFSAAAAALRTADIEAPRREAIRIWADLHDQTPGAALAAIGARATPEEKVRYQAAIARRAAGEPLAYVTGVAGFRRLTLRSDRRALIPRPETEGLVDLVLQRVSRGRVADVGTGSGCVALALADEGRFDLIVGVDRSSEAIALAGENRHRTELPVALVRGDLTSPFAPASFEAVVSNPPYLSEAEYGVLDPSVRDWEPRAALASGEDGLWATRALLTDARRVVRPGGWLVLEVDATRAEDTARLARGAGWDSMDIHTDLFGRARYVLARRSEAE